MDIENTTTPSAVSVQSPAPTMGTGTKVFNESQSGITRRAPLSIMGLEGVVKDGYTPEESIKGCKAGYTHMASELADEFGRHHLVVFSKPEVIPTLEGSILVPEENTTTELQSGARVTKYDLSNQGWNRDLTGQPVDQINVSLGYDKPPTEEEVASMVPEHTEGLCDKWRHVKVDILCGELPTEASETPDTVVLQG